MSKHIHVVGAGLAGAEAAWQIAEAGVEVVLHEMRPTQTTPAHQTDYFAELVCSNSLKAKSIENAAGLLKEELRRLGSLIMAAADTSEVPAGQALAVDRTLFAAAVTEKLRAHPRVIVVEEEVTDLPPLGEEPWVIATGPLTSPRLAEALRILSGEDYLYFFDAAAPIVTLESLDMEKVFRATRYDKGEADYLNCPLNREEYHAFWEALSKAEQHPLHDFEDRSFFEGCIPVEELARRGEETLAFGPMKPVGLTDPRTGRYPHAVVQLRQDNVGGDLFNLVGFQTNLRFGEQERVFRMIPGLENAEFVRYGVMHRNLFLNSPRLLAPTLRLKTRPDLWFAGQMTGVEGYIESAATGWLAGRNAARVVMGYEPLEAPRMTMLGALLHYICHADEKHFQPMNAVFGIMPPLQDLNENEGRKPRKVPKKQRQQLYAARALENLELWRTLI